MVNEDDGPEESGYRDCLFMYECMICGNEKMREMDAVAIERAAVRDWYDETNPMGDQAKSSNMDKRYVWCDIGQ